MDTDLHGYERRAGATAGLPSSVVATSALLDKPAVAHKCEALIDGMATDLAAFADTIK